MKKQTKHPAAKQSIDRFTLAMIVLVMGILGTLFGIWLKETYDVNAKRSARERTMELRRWNEIPFTPVASLPPGTPPELTLPMPIAPEAVALLDSGINYIQQGHGHPISRQDMQKLLTLIWVHPDRELAEHLWQEISRGTVLIGFGYDLSKGMAAEYTYIVDVGENGKQRELPMMVFGVNEAATLSPDDFLRWFIKLEHEYTHLDQSRDANGVPSASIFTRKDAWCELHWKAELGAYNQECTLALSWGKPELTVANGELCRRYSTEAAYRQYLFAYGIKAYLSKQPQCAVTWARLAGHPHPEAFVDWPN